MDTQSILVQLDCAGDSLSVTEMLHAPGMLSCRLCSFRALLPSEGCYREPSKAKSPLGEGTESVNMGLEEMGSGRDCPWIAGRGSLGRQMTLVSQGSPLRKT